MIRRLKWWAWDSGKDFHPSPEESHSFFVGLMTGCFCATMAFVIGQIFWHMIS